MYNKQQSEKSQKNFNAQGLAINLINSRHLAISQSCSATTRPIYENTFLQRSNYVLYEF